MHWACRPGSTHLCILVANPAIQPVTADQTSAEAAATVTYAASQDAAATPASDTYPVVEDTTGVSATMIAAYRLLLAQPASAARKLWFDLLFDERFLAALHTHVKIVE